MYESPDEYSPDKLVNNYNRIVGNTSVRGSNYSNNIADFDYPVSTPSITNTSQISSGINDYYSPSIQTSETTKNRRKCTNCKDGIEKYTPWMGSVPDTYCEICRTTGYPHTHRQCTICNGNVWIEY